MDKYFPIFILIFFVLLIPVVLYLILKPMLKQNNVLNGVVNYDTFMRKFVFRVNSSKDDIIKFLKNKNVSDELNYTLNDDATIITFEKHNAKIPYTLKIEPYDECCIIKTEQIPVITDRSNIPYYINSFWIQKLNAVPLDYSSYEF